jgi:hypothetical protein
MAVTSLSGLAKRHDICRNLIRISKLPATGLVSP